MVWAGAWLGPTLPPPPGGGRPRVGWVFLGKTFVTKIFLSPLSSGSSVQNPVGTILHLQPRSPGFESRALG